MDVVRSANQQRARLIQQMRAAGRSWVEIGEDFRERYGANARAAMRLAHGWSQRQAAVEWCQRWPDDPKDEKRFSYWESWPVSGYPPSLATLDRLAELYQCGVADLLSGFGDYRYLDGSTSIVVSVGRPFDGLDDLGELDEESTDVDRRTLIAGTLASALVGSAARPADVAPEVVRYFRGQLDGLYRADRLLGPHPLIDVAVPQYRLIRRTAEVAQGDLHRKLLEVATSFGGLIGWLHQDAGNMSAATTWLNETLDLAHRTGDPQIVSYALSNKAMLRVDLGDGLGAVDLAKAALVGPTLCPKAQVMAMQQAAIGCSLTGDRGAVDRYLDDMAELVEQAAADDQPWGGDRLRHTPGHVELQRATCYTRLGLAAEAADLWRATLDRQPSGSRRDRGVYLARYATSLAGLGESDEAARRATDAVQHLAETGSARMRRELLALRKRAGSIAGRAGRDLSDVLEGVT